MRSPILIRRPPGGPSKEFMVSTLRDPGDRTVASEVRRPSLKSIVATGMGNTLEWFDWGIYATFATYLSAQFFSRENPCHPRRPAYEPRGPPHNGDPPIPPRQRSISQRIPGPGRTPHRPRGVRAWMPYPAAHTEGDRMGVLAGAEPFGHPGSAETGFLLCHGFTGTPASMRAWGAHLAGAGFTVRCPLLPGHGTRWQDLNRTTWEDWYGAVREALLALLATCRTVFVGGLSMGGTLTLRLAEEFGDR